MGKRPLGTIGKIGPTQEGERIFFEFTEWATSFLLISWTEINNSKTLFSGLTLEEAKMAFSNEYQKLFEASWNLIKLEKFPIKDKFWHTFEIGHGYYGDSYERGHGFGNNDTSTIFKGNEIPDRRFFGNLGASNYSFLVFDDGSGVGDPLYYFSNGQSYLHLIGAGAG